MIIQSDNESLYLGNRGLVVVGKDGLFPVLNCYFM